jgi:hypothetical protein
MCTVTVLPLGGGFRLAFSRDEQRSRPSALAPREALFGPRRALLPLDPTSGGTWVGANDLGLAAALLNLNRPPLARLAPRRSRGTIVPALLGAGDVYEALGRAVRLPLDDFAPFRLVIIHEKALAELAWDGAGAGARKRALDRPVLFTSSGLGDRLVEGPRRALFEALVLPAPTPEAQDRYHRHRWADCPEWSVCMSRPDAATVSLTVVTARPGSVELTYLPNGPTGPALPPVRLTPSRAGAS